MVGSVYVKFKDENDAAKAMQVNPSSFRSFLLLPFLCRQWRAESFWNCKVVRTAGLLVQFCSNVVYNSCTIESSPGVIACYERTMVLCDHSRLVPQCQFLQMSSGHETHRLQSEVVGSSGISLARPSHAVLFLSCGRGREERGGGGGGAMEKMAALLYTTYGIRSCGLPNLSAWNVSSPAPASLCTAQGLMGRYYEGRPIMCEFSPVTDFREATCRQYEENTCTRGGYCNFMHLRPISRSPPTSPSCRFYPLF